MKRKKASDLMFSRHKKRVAQAEGREIEDEGEGLFGEDDEDEEEDEGYAVPLYIPMTLIIIILVLLTYIVAKNLDIGPKTMLKPDTGEKTVTETAAKGESLELDTRLMEQKEEPQGALTARNVFFAGIEDSVFYGEGRIALDNLAENEDFLMRYEVYDTGSDELIFETGLIPSGERVYFDPYSVLKPGIYRLRFTAVPYMEQNGGYLALTNGSNEVTIELKARSGMGTPDQQEGEVYEENEEN